MTNLTISTLLVQPFINVDQNYIGLADRIFKISKITGISLFLLTSTSNCITFTSYILDIWSVLNPLKILDDLATSGRHNGLPIVGKILFNKNSTCGG